MSANILDGKVIAKNILEEVSCKVSELKTSGWDPKLISIKVGDNPAVDLYIRNQRLKAEKIGIIFEEKSTRMIYPRMNCRRLLPILMLIQRSPASFYSVLFPKVFPLKLCRKLFIHTKMWRECTPHRLEILFIMNWNLAPARPWLQ